MSWRYLAQRTRTGEWLDWDLPLSEVQITYALSGPPGLNATISPEVARLIGEDGHPILSEWATTIYAEADGQIRFGGVLVHSSYGDDGGWQLECMGFSGYPTGIPYLGSYTEDSVDPLDVVREIWDHVQTHDGGKGDLGVVVDDTSSPVRIGKVQKHIPLTTEDASVDSNPQPYVLVWWEAKDCGQEIDALAKQAPFDYLEEHAWDGDEVTHRLRLGYPRFGRKRDDLRFMQGENIAVLPSPEVQGDEFANEVYGIGAGEGSKALKTSVTENDGKLRRVHVFHNSGVDKKDRLDMLSREQLKIRNPMLQLADVQIIDHPNAPLGSWRVGDDILVQGEIPWRGEFSLWCRVVSATFAPEDPGQATLQLARSDSFTYGEIQR